MCLDPFSSLLIAVLKEIGDIFRLRGRKTYTQYAILRPYSDYAIFAPESNLTCFALLCGHCRQLALLSQRGRAMLHICQ